MDTAESYDGCNAIWFSTVHKSTAQSGRSDDKDVSISGNPVFRLTWDSLRPPNQPTQQT